MAKSTLKPLAAGEAINTVVQVLLTAFFGTYSTFIVLRTDVRKSEECISLDSDGGDKEEIVDSSRRSPRATVLSTCLRNFPGQWHQKGDNEPRSEISLLHSDDENETERQEAKPPSPPVSLPLHAAAVDPNGATVSPTIPRGTEVTARKRRMTTRNHKWYTVLFLRRGQLLLTTASADLASPVTFTLTAQLPTFTRRLSHLATRS
nr:unnamed protein product [Spirometra erinaceieuropaei]